MPPRLAARFTLSELAALRIISDEVMANGHCDRPLAEIAARAGVGRTTVQNALREAARLGLVTVQERRRQGQVNLPNVVRVVSREWLQWLKLRRRSEQAKGGEGIGFRNANPTDKNVILKGSRTAPAFISARGQKAKPGAPRSGIAACGGTSWRTGRDG
jgi:DNA-binding transcriptional ArsR family regulator